MTIHGFIGRNISTGSPVFLKCSLTSAAVSFDTTPSKVRPSLYIPLARSIGAALSDSASARFSSSTSVPDASNAFSNGAGSGYASEPSACTEPARYITFAPERTVHRKCFPVAGACAAELVETSADVQIATRTSRAVRIFMPQVSATEAMKTTRSRATENREVWATEDTEITAVL